MPFFLSRRQYARCGKVAEDGVRRTLTVERAEQIVSDVVVPAREGGDVDRAKAAGAAVGLETVKEGLARGRVAPCIEMEMFVDDGIGRFHPRTPGRVWFRPREGGDFGRTPLLLPGSADSAEEAAAPDLRVRDGWALSNCGKRVAAPADAPEVYSPRAIEVKRFRATCRVDFKTGKFVESKTGILPQPEWTDFKHPSPLDCSRTG